MQYFIRHTENPEKDLVINRSSIAFFDDRKEAEMMCEEEYEIVEADGGFYISLQGLCGYGSYENVDSAREAINEYDGDSENGSAGDGSGWKIFEGEEIDDDPVSSGIVFRAKKIVK